MESDFLCGREARRVRYKLARNHTTWVDETERARASERGRAREAILFGEMRALGAANQNLGYCLQRGVRARGRGFKAARFKLFSVMYLFRGAFKA